MEETYERSIFDEETSVVYGGFWERFGALFLDGLILAPLSVVNYYNQSSWKSLPLLLAASLVAMAYKPLLEYLYGATPGKKALSLAVVNRDYGKINTTEAVLRNIFGLVIGVAGLIISIYTFGRITPSPKPITSLADVDSKLILTGFLSIGVFFIYLADAICLIANSRKQSLHDLIAKTYVIRK